MVSGQQGDNPAILTEADGAIGRRVISNPRRRNALNLDMWRAIPPAIQELDQRPETRLIIITGAGESFASGADISEFEETRMGAGSARATEILATARRVEASEALSMGLVNRVVEAPRLDEEITELSGLVARNAPLAIRAGKQAVRAILTGEFGARRGELDAAVNDCFDSADYAEGCAAFLEKRVPDFQGK